MFSETEDKADDSGPSEERYYSMRQEASFIFTDMDHEKPWELLHVDAI